MKTIHGIVLTTLLCSSLWAINPLFTRHRSILEAGRRAGVFRTFDAALVATGLDELLHNDGPYTIFAPVDIAFGQQAQGGVAVTMARGNTDELRRLVSRHIVPGVLLKADLRGGETLITLEGEPIVVSLEQGALWAHDARFLYHDIRCANGVVHVVDTFIEW